METAQVTYSLSTKASTREALTEKKKPKKQLRSAPGSPVLIAHVDALLDH